MTREATHFITPLTFQTLSGHRVYHDVFEAPEEWDLLHPSLSMAADLVVICPATMNILAKVAHGICDDLVTSVVFATKAPILIVPAITEQSPQPPAPRAPLAPHGRLG